MKTYRPSRKQYLPATRTRTPEERMVSACLDDVVSVGAMVLRLESLGCKSEGSVAEVGGTIEVTTTVRDGETTVYRAIQKSPGQSWIIAYYVSDRVTWTD